MKRTEATRQYWLDVVLGWAESRLMPPQYDECKIALTTPAPYILAELAAARAALAAVAALRDRYRTLALGHAAIMGGHYTYWQVAADLDALLAGPETREEYAAHLAEHREEERLQRMDEADAGEEREA